jgi:hypothetical protein
LQDTLFQSAHGGCGGLCRSIPSSDVGHIVSILQPPTVDHHPIQGVDQTSTLVAQGLKKQWLCVKSHNLVFMLLIGQSDVVVLYRWASFSNNRALHDSIDPCLSRVRDLPPPLHGNTAPFPLIRDTPSTPPLHRGRA